MVDTLVRGDKYVDETAGSAMRIRRNPRLSNLDIIPQREILFPLPKYLPGHLGRECRVPKYHPSVKATELGTTDQSGAFTVISRKSSSIFLVNLFTASLFLPSSPEVKSSAYASILIGIPYLPGSARLSHNADLPDCHATPILRLIHVCDSDRNNHRPLALLRPSVLLRPSQVT